MVKLMFFRGFVYWGFIYSGRITGKYKDCQIKQHRLRLTAMCCNPSKAHCESGEILNKAVLLMKTITADKLTTNITYPSKHLFW